jgi:hypothetical protein
MFLSKDGPGPGAFGPFPVVGTYTILACGHLSDNGSNLSIGLFGANGLNLLLRAARTAVLMSVLVFWLFSVSFES